VQLHVLQPHITRKLYIALTIIVLFVFARSFYYTGIAAFYPLYLLDAYEISVSQVQLYSFLFLGAGALSTFLGGPISDRIGRKRVIVFSMVAALPLAFLLPYAGLGWAIPLCFVLGFTTLASFSVTVVYAQDLFPRHIGTMSGLVVGFAFGMGAISSLLFGWLADVYSLQFVMQLSSWLPLLGSVALFLPADETLRQWNRS
jgi:FSR family fosmidomycin resistance protein-like MFS transporter